MSAPFFYLDFPPGTRPAPQSISLRLGPRSCSARSAPQSISLQLGPRSCSARSAPRSISLQLGPRSCSARSAPRAHVRELLCETQSSKEQLRRSRTESSGAAPAIEELAGEARQVRPAGPRADKYQSGPDFSPAGRSGGRPALQLPRALNSSGSSIFPLSPDRLLAEVGNSRFGSVFSHLRGGYGMLFPAVSGSSRQMRSVVRPQGQTSRLIRTRSPVR